MGADILTQRADDYLDDLNNIFYIVRQNTNSVIPAKDFENQALAVVKMFPFSMNQPTWAQCILMDKFNIKDYEITIRLLNSGEGDEKATVAAEFKYVEKRHK